MGWMNVPFTKKRARRHVRMIKYGRLLTVASLLADESQAPLLGTPPDRGWSGGVSG